MDTVSAYAKNEGNLKFVSLIRCVLTGFPMFLASQDALEVMYVSQSVSEWVSQQIETLLM